MPIRWNGPAEHRVRSATEQWCQKSTHIFGINMLSNNPFSLSTLRGPTPDQRILITEPCQGDDGLIAAVPRRAIRWAAASRVQCVDPYTIQLSS